MHNFLYSLTIYLLHYYPGHVSSINMPIFRRKNCIHTASGIFALCKRLHSILAESGLQSVAGYVADLSWKSGARAIEKLDRLRSTMAVNVLSRVCCLTWIYGTIWACCRRLRFDYSGTKEHHCALLINVGRDSSVGIATRYRLVGPGIESLCGRDFPHLSRPALGGPSSRLSFPRAKRPGRGTDLNPHLAPRLKKEYIYPPCLGLRGRF